MATVTWTRRDNDLLSLAALGLLVERPRHTYEIQRVLRERHKEFASGTPRAIYRAVDRLCQGGMIELADTVREGHRPERIVYRATEQGQEELRHWLIDLLGLPQSDPASFAAAVSMIGYLQAREALRALAQRVAQLQGRIAALDAVLSSLLEQFGMPRLFLLEREYERSLWRAELEWVSQLIEELRSGALAVDQSWLHQELGDEAAPLHMPGDPLALQPPGPLAGGGSPQLKIHQGDAS
ncbi:MAG: PadR family transcriptional regulator [Candidatus Dormibacteria bacterium]